MQHPPIFDVQGLFYRVEEKIERYDTPPPVGTGYNPIDYSHHGESLTVFDVRRFTQAAFSGFLVRRHAILFGFRQLRAIVLHDRVFCVRVQDALAEDYDLSLAPPVVVHGWLFPTTNDGQIQFERFCIQSLLDKCLEKLGEAVESFETAVLGLVVQQNGGVGEGDLIGKLATAGTLAAALEDFVQCLSSLLKDGNSLALMNLTALAADTTIYDVASDSILAAAGVAPARVVEPSLGSANTLKARLADGKENLKLAFSLMNQARDQYRNRALWANLIVSLFSLVVACGSFIGSLFGMNVPNELQANNDAFNKLAGWTVGAMIAATIGLLVVLKAFGAVPKPGVDV